ncbi:MAG: hypothetical protein HZA81_04495 [Candidatus Taylorbacteria bacterium]|nr:hypothetical protein [Candidatus Taylorbacteria bacterium]
MRFSFFLKIAFAIVLLSSPLFSHAGTEHNMTGYAWSSNIGWISFNCTNESTCGTVNYGVNKAADGTMTGYAWSSAIGWIQFGGLSGFPSGSGTTAVNAQVVGSNVQGWARALSYSGTWDGWISLAGTSPSYGVTHSGGSFAGYAWGGEVVGWVLFDVQGVYPAICSDCGVTIEGDASLDIKSGGVSIVGNGAVPYGTIPVFEWTLVNMPVGTTCSVSKTSAGGTSFTTITNIGASGTYTGSALTNTSYTYQISCTNGVLKTASFTVAPQPPGFSLGSSETVAIQFVSPGSAVSEEKSVFVNAIGGYSNPVTISITGFPPAIASTTFSYSFNGGSSYSSSPTANITSPYSSGIGFKVRVTRLSGAPAFTGPYTITLTGTGSGAPNATKSMIINPTSFIPKFEEF